MRGVQTGPLGPLAWKGFKTCVVPASLGFQIPG